jgi:hypothetical protein
MARLASIEIGLVSRIPASNSSMDVIHALLSSEWRCSDEKCQSYLPVGDDGDFDWQRDELSNEQLFKIFLEKEEKGELIGTVLTWGDTGIGGDLLVRKDQTFSFILSINKKMHELLDIPDFYWYLERLLPPLRRSAFIVESIALYDQV